MDDLFTSQNAYRPLAERMRPKHIDDYLGQSHLLGDSGPLRKAIEQKILHSMILWGPQVLVKQASHVYWQAILMLIFFRYRLFSEASRRSARR